LLLDAEHDTRISGQEPTAVHRRKSLLVQNMVEKDLWVFSFDGKNLKDTGQRIKVKGGAASIGIAGNR
jgi:hypothetical protein